MWIGGPCDIVISLLFKNIENIRNNYNKSSLRVPIKNEHANHFCVTELLVICSLANLDSNIWLTHSMKEFI